MIFTWKYKREREREEKEGGGSARGCGNARRVNARMINEERWIVRARPPPPPRVAEGRGKEEGEGKGDEPNRAYQSRLLITRVPRVTIRAHEARARD